MAPGSPLGVSLALEEGLGATFELNHAPGVADSGEVREIQLLPTPSDHEPIRLRIEARRLVTEGGRNKASMLGLDVVAERRRNFVRCRRATD